MQLEELNERSWQLSREVDYVKPGDRFAALVLKVGELTRSLLIHRRVKANTESDDSDIALAGVVFGILVLARLIRSNRRGIALAKGSSRAHGSDEALP